MQPEWAIAVVERASERTWIAAGAAGAALSLLLVAWAPAIVDVALVGLAIGAGIGGWRASRLRAELDSLPLEVAPVIGAGLVDGVRVYRFRVRLGRGRELRMPEAMVSFEDEDGERYALPAEIPADHLWGPFTVVASDPRHWCSGPGKFEVRVACEAEGRRWAATASLDRDRTRDGWFVGPDTSRGGVRHRPDWDTLTTGR